MGFFDTLKGPVFLKTDSEAERQLLQLNELRAEETGEVAEKIEQQIRLVEAGISGEQSVRFELENSYIPMYVLHDLYLEHEGLSAQIDYLIITRKHQFVIECKNLYGDIEINNAGDFVRTFSYGNISKKEGIYSPITQNRRHLELIKQIRSAEKSNFLLRSIFEKNFYDNYRSVVVLSNPKTILNAKYAKKEVRDQVIRVDQLIEYIRNIDAQSSTNTSEKEMEQLANFFLSIHKENKTDYTAPYRNAIERAKETAPPEKEEPPAPSQILCPKCGAVMVKRTATKGPRAGSSFYGCSQFPKCRGILQIQDV